jgi:N-acetylglucosamine-6-phosphate deacetylase
MLIFNAHLYTPSGLLSPGWLLTEAGRIKAMDDGLPPHLPSSQTHEVLDAQGKSVLPGFIDLHAHGALGCEAMDGTPQCLVTLARAYARHGVTSFLPTSWTASGTAISAVLEAVKVVKGCVEGGAEILGVHLEGPYLNPERCGAQDNTLIRRAERAEALPWLESGIVRLLTLAPEYEENKWLISECVRRGIAVNAGHTSASYEEIRTAVQLGLSGITHCFNAMPPLNHRNPGVLGAALTLPELRCELIADNIHVAPPVMALLVKAKGTAGINLITDAVRPTGLPDGSYPIDDHRTIMLKDSAARLPDGTLAGSTLTMERALHNIQQAAGLSLADAWEMSSLTAARAIGLESDKGTLSPGKHADLVLIDQQGEVNLTVVRGRVVFRK